MRFRAMGFPMMPRPIKPIVGFAIVLFLPVMTLNCSYSDQLVFLVHSVFQVLRVQRKLLKSWMEKISARGPGMMFRYQRIAIANGTRGRSNIAANTKPSALRRPLTM